MTSHSHDIGHHLEEERWEQLAKVPAANAVTRRSRLQVQGLASSLLPPGPVSVRGIAAMGRLLALGVVAMTLVVAGCGDGNSDSSASAHTTAPQVPLGRYRGQIHLPGRDVWLGFDVRSTVRQGHKILYVYLPRSGRVALECNRGTERTRIPPMAYIPLRGARFRKASAAPIGTGYEAKSNFGGRIQGKRAHGDFSYGVHKSSGQHCSTGGRLHWTARFR